MEPTWSGSEHERQKSASWPENCRALFSPFVSKLSKKHDKSILAVGEGTT